MMIDITYSIFEESYVNELYSDLKNLYESFILKGHYIVIVEMGVTNKNKTEERLNGVNFLFLQLENLICLVMYGIRNILDIVI